jgi:hypothetical protein
MRWKITLAVALVLLGLVGAWTFLALRDSSGSLSTFRLPDGTDARIETITFGTNHAFTKGNRLVGKVHRFLPTSLKTLLTAPFSTEFTTREETLVLWYNRFDPNTRSYPPANFQSFKIIDEHGCAFYINHYGGGSTTPAFSISSANASVFPRRQKSFKVGAEVFGVTNIQWTVENPFVTNPAAWKAERLPATRRYENIEFILQTIDGQFYASGDWFEPKFSILEDGVDRTEWYKPLVMFVDATGNRDDRLCPYEPAWKLEVDFYKSHKAPFSEPEIWRVRDVRIPRSGEVVSLNSTGDVSGISLEIFALCGSGEFSFSNRVCVASNEWAATWQGESSSYSSGVNNQVRLTFRSKKPSLVAEISGLKRREDLLIRLRDEHRRSYPVDFRGSADKTYRYNVEAPKEAQKVDIEVVRQNAPRLEYVVEPPRPKGNRRK